MQERRENMPGEARNLLREISQEEALRYLGVRGTPDDQLRADLDRCAEQLSATARPRAVWKLFSVEADGCLAGTNFRPAGEDIRSMVIPGGQVVLMAATLGLESETLIRRAQGSRMAEAVLLDALASAAIENVCDNLCRELAGELAPRHLTPRFSPGYGDFPLSQQGELLSVLNASRRLGISLTPGGLMIPQKSVTALMGVTEEGTEGEPLRKCEGCAAADRCPYRRENRGCGKTGGE